MPRMRWLAKDIPSKCVAVGGLRTSWHFDGIANLVLDALPDGTRVWRVRYRPRNATSDRAIKLGTLGVRANELTPGMARDRRDAIMARVAEGRDPFMEERAKQSQPASQSLAACWCGSHS